MDKPSVSILPIALVAIAVFSVATILRVPSCYESFWIDELHSAWVVWDGLGDVTERAKLGHQSPFYFIGLWGWKQLFGGSELALRVSSVLTLATSCVVLTIGVTHWSKGIAAGAVAGMMLATEINSVFFGTELRPYALVVLFASIALVVFLPLLQTKSRHDQRWYWLTLNAAVLLAILCQPTSAGLLMLPGSLLAIWLIRDPRKFLRFNLSDAFIVISAAAVAFALWRVTLNDSWEQRNAWNSFASASNVRQIYRIWDWDWLWLAPLIVTFTACALAVTIGRLRDIRGSANSAIVLAILALLMTTTYWFVSWMNWVPLWHRRYFIAVLPIFACLSGAALATLRDAIPRNQKSDAAVAIITCILILMIPYQQGVLKRLPQYPVALVSRGEDWRDAIQWVRFNARPNDLIYLDAGLIENKAWLNPVVAPPQAPKMSVERRDYLVYAILGPYALGRKANPINASGAISFKTGNASRRIFLIQRRPVSRVPPSVLDSRTHAYGFGNVSVLMQSSRLDDLIL
ncbi:MAG: hypothetical protein AAGG48_09220 [Planctomycetota bacterium]